MKNRGSGLKTATLGAVDDWELEATGTNCADIIGFARIQASYLKLNEVILPIVEHSALLEIETRLHSATVSLEVSLSMTSEQHSESKTCQRQSTISKTHSSGSEAERPTSFKGR